MWGYFIEQLHRRTVQKITFLPTNGYTVCDLDSQLLNKSFTITAKYVNVFNNSLFTRDFTLTPRGTLSISGNNRNVILSVEIQNKFFTTQHPSGGPDEIHIYTLDSTVSLMDAYGYTPIDTLAPGATVFTPNHYQLEVISVNTAAGTYDAVTIHDHSSDIWYLINDIRNTLINHINDFNNPHHVSLSQADNYQDGDFIIHHNMYYMNNIGGNKYVTYNEAISISGGGTLTGKFHSSQNGTGLVGEYHVYSTYLAIPYITGEVLSVGSTVFLANRYEVIVTAVNGANYTAQTVSTWSGDISYLLSELLNDITNLTTTINNLADDLDDHIHDYNNPHHTSLSQAEVYQGTTPLVINHDIYKTSQINSNRFITYDESVSIATTIVAGGTLYRGQVKYGGDSTAVFSAIGTYGLAIGDVCIIQAITVDSPIEFYMWNGSGWIIQAITNAIGDYYDILFWYGTWYDGIYYPGDVSARTTCSDAATNKWDLIVYTDLVLDGSITTQKLADNAVTNGKLATMPAYTLKGNNTSVTANPQDLDKNSLKLMLGFIESSDVTTIINAEVGDRTINIQKNGTTVGTFTTNENNATPKNINIAIPTVAVTTNLLKGDNYGNAIAAIPGTDYPTVDQITGILNEIENINTSISNLNSRVTTIEGKITTIEGDIVTIKGDITTIKNRLTTVEGDITNIKSDITDIYQDITDINTDITNITNNLSNLTTTVNNLQTTVNNTITNMSGICFKILYWNASTGVITMQTNLVPTVRNITTTAGVTIPGTWSAISGTAPNVNFTFNPTTATTITTGDWILIVY
jgi:archaellum component FlaC